MNLEDIPEERLETGSVPSPPWGKANPREKWTYIGAGAAAVLGLECLALLIWGVTLIS